MDALGFRTLSLFHPLSPDFLSLADSRLLSVSNNRCAQQRGVLEQLFKLRIGQQIVKKCSIRVLFVQELLHAANSAHYAFELAFTHAFARQVHGLKFDAALVKKALGFFGIKTLGFAKNLNIHGITSKRNDAPDRATMECGRNRLQQDNTMRSNPLLISRKTEFFLGGSLHADLIQVAA